MSDNLTVVTTGAGEIGPLEPGWSVEEFATPANPNEQAGGTGTVGFSGVDYGEGLLLVNNGSTVSNDALGSVSGVIRSASKSGQRITCSQDTLLAQYDVIRNMPPMIAASVPGAIDLADQVLKTNLRFTEDKGYFWSLNGHIVGFDGEGNQVVQSSENVSYTYYRNDLAQFVTSTVTQNQLTLGADSMSIIDGKTYAQSVVGDNFVLSRPAGFYSSFQTPDTKLQVQGKAMLEGGDLVFDLTGQPSGPADEDYYTKILATIDYSAETVIVYAEYRSGGSITSTTDTTSIASLNLDAEIGFRFWFSERFTIDSVLVANMSVCNTSNYSTVIESEIAYTPDSFPIWYDPWTISGNVRALWYRNDSQGSTFIPSWTASEWEQPVSYTVVGTPVLGEPSIGFDGNVWEWLQNACTVYRWEIGLQNNAVVARPIGSKVFNVDNVAGSPATTATTTFAGRRVDVGYSNAVVASNELVYEARADDNRILTVGAAQTTVTAIQTDAYLTSILQPLRVTTFIPGAGTYYVVDSTGLPVVVDQWEDYDGEVSVAIDPESPGVINVTLTGPTEEIPSTTAPYSLAVSDGDNQYAAFSIIGSGVIATPETLELLTGADRAKTLQELAFTISNPFISTFGQAFDTGIWATVEASGPRLSISLTVPTNSVEGFGLAQGSVFRHDGCDYRITDADLGRTSTTINGVRHVTVDAFDTAWAGSDVADHDAVWADYVCEDQKPLPFKGTG